MAVAQNFAEIKNSEKNIDFGSIFGLFLSFEVCGDICELSMSDKTPKKKRRRKTSSTNSAEKTTKESQETKEARVKSKGKSKKGKMASNQGSTSSTTSSMSNLPGSTTVPGTVYTSAPYFFPPNSATMRFPNVPNMPPITSVFPPTSINPVTQTVNSQPQTVPMPSMNDFTSQFLTQLNFIMSKVSKLDGIETQQAAILSRLNHIETTVSQNKVMIQSNTKQITDIEKSQSFLSSQYDSVCKTTDANKENVSKTQTELKKVSKENNRFKKEKRVAGGRYNLPKM